MLPSERARAPAPKTGSTLRVALAVAALLAPAILAVEPVAAQVPGQYDLHVKDITFEYPPTVDNLTRVYVTVANLGPSPVSASQSFYLRAYWNRSGGTVSTTQCDDQLCSWLWQRGTPPEKKQRSERLVSEAFAVGQSKTFIFEWNPTKESPLIGPQGGPGLVIVRAIPIAGQPAPADGNPDNNEYAQPVLVRNPRVFSQNRWSPEFVDAANKVTEDCIGRPYPPGGFGAETKPCRYVPGQTLQFKIFVENKGNSVDTLVPEVVDLSPFRTYNKTGSWNITFVPPKPLLGPKQNATILMVVQTARTGESVIANRTINTDVNPAVKIFVNSSINPLVTSDPITLFPSVKAKHRFAMNITSLEPRKVVNATDPQGRKYNFTLNNNGNGCDSARLSVNYRKSSIVKDLWDVDFAPVGAAELTVLPNGHNVTNRWGSVLGTQIEGSCDPADAIHQNFTVTVKPPPTALAGRHHFVVETLSRGETAENPDALDDFNFTLYVLQHYALSSSIASPNQRKTPGKTSVYEMVVSNNGNGPDTVRARLDTPGLLPGWTARLSRDTITIPPASSATFYLNVTPPPGELENRFLHAFVNVTSGGPVNLTEDQRDREPFRLATEVARGPTIVLTTPDTSASTFIDPGANRTFSFRVRNDGNIVDNFTFEVDRPLGWTATTSTERIQLGPRQEAGFSVTITAPAGARIGDRASPVVRVKSTAAPSEGAQGVLALTISGPDLFASALQTDKPTVFSGDKVTLTATIGNRGNHDAPKEAIVRFVYSTGGTERLIAEQVLTNLVKSSSRTVTAAWNTTGLGGAGTIIVRVDPPGDIVEIDEGNNEATIVGDRAFVRTFGLSLSEAAGLTGRAGERLRYEEQPNAFVLENRGNRPEEVLAVLTSTQGWAKPGHVLYPAAEVPDYVMDVFGLAGATGYVLAPGAKIVVPFAVHIPEFPGAGADTATLRIVPASRPDAAASLTRTVTTTLVDKEAPTILDVKATPGQANLGQKVNLTAFVQDAVGLKSVKAFVKGPDNVTETLELARGAGDVWFVERAWPSVGAFTFYVEAVDNSKDANRANTQKSPSSLLVKPGSAPKITLVTSTKAPIRAGTPVEFQITDPLGVARASVLVGQTETQLPRTWRFDTTNLTEGTARLLVKAENIYGVKAEQAFTIEVDNTPPELTKLTVDPARPKAGQELTLRITTNASTQAVDVVVKRDGQVVETKAATRQGPGLFTMKYTPTSGQYTFDVVAKDEAGNENVAEGVVAFKAGGAFTPVPVWVALVAVAFAVFLARRRR